MHQYDLVPLPPNFHNSSYFEPTNRKSERQYYLPLCTVGASSTPDVSSTVIETSCLPHFPAQTCIMLHMTPPWPLVTDCISLLCILYTVQYEIMDCLARGAGKRGRRCIAKWPFPMKHTYQMHPMMHLKSPHGHQMAVPLASLHPRKYIMVE